MQFVQQTHFEPPSSFHPLQRILRMRFTFLSLAKSSLVATLSDHGAAKLDGFGVGPGPTQLEDRAACPKLDCAALFLAFLFCGLDTGMQSFRLSPRDFIMSCAARYRSLNG